MTPMQSLKPQFDALCSLLDGWETVALNHAEPREYVARYCGERDVYSMKGVRSKFIKLFQKKYRQDHGWSFGFSFDYDEADTNISHARVIISLKVLGFDSQYWTSEALDVYTVRERMLTFQRELEHSRMNDDAIANAFKVTFVLVSVPQRRRRKMT
jgi:hypothetical protein